MNDKFDEAYIYLSGDGICDLPGGKEHQRVRQEWIDSGKPADVVTFIRESANREPEGVSYNAVLDSIFATLHRSLLDGMTGWCHVCVNKKGTISAVVSTAEPTSNAECAVVWKSHLSGESVLVLEECSMDKAQFYADDEYLTFAASMDCRHTIPICVSFDVVRRYNLIDIGRQVRDNLTAAGFPFTLP